MREILFRGKRTNNGEWVEGCLIVFPDEECFVCSPSDEPDVLDKFWVRSETVGQYTGLTDKNGRKIFEGDILNGLMSTMVVFFGEIIGEGYGFQWKMVSGNPRNAESMTGFIDEYEVIGNIHDNKLEDFNGR